MTGNTGKLAAAMAIAGTVLGAFFMQSSIEDRVADLETRVAILEASRGPESEAEPASAEVHELTGVIVVLYSDAASWRIDEPCTGQGGYDDLRAGAQVVVSDDTGKTVATGRLGSGTGVSRVQCQFPFRVPDVPVADFYTVEISHRGGLTYSFDELDGLDWHLELSIGT